MERNKQRGIASKGGKAAHKKGAAHEWTREEAQEAGRKGGLARHRKRRDQSPPPDGDQLAQQDPHAGQPAVQGLADSQ